MPRVDDQDGTVRATPGGAAVAAGVPGVALVAHAAVAEPAHPVADSSGGGVTST